MSKRSRRKASRKKRRFAVRMEQLRAAMICLGHTPEEIDPDPKRYVECRECHVSYALETMHIMSRCDPYKPVQTYTTTTLSGTRFVTGFDTADFRWQNRWRGTQ